DGERAPAEASRAVLSAAVAGTGGAGSASRSAGRARAAPAPQPARAAPAERARNAPPTTRPSRGRRWESSGRRAGRSSPRPWCECTQWLQRHERALATVENGARTARRIRPPPPQDRRGRLDCADDLRCLRRQAGVDALARAVLDPGLLGL